MDPGERAHVIDLLENCATSRRSSIRAQSDCPALRQLPDAVGHVPAPVLCRRTKCWPETGWRSPSGRRPVPAPKRNATSPVRSSSTGAPADSSVTGRPSRPKRPASSTRTSSDILMTPKPITRRRTRSQRRTLPPMWGGHRVAEEFAGPGSFRPAQVTVNGPPRQQRQRRRQFLSRENHRDDQSRTHDARASTEG